MEHTIIHYLTLALIVVIILIALVAIGRRMLSREEVHYDTSRPLTPVTAPADTHVATTARATAPATAHSAGHDSHGDNWFMSAIKFVGWAIVIVLGLGIFWGLFGQDLFTWATRPHVVHEVPRDASGHVVHTQTAVAPPLTKPSSASSTHLALGDCSVMPDSAATPTAGADYGPPTALTYRRTICTDVPLSSPHLSVQCRFQRGVGDWVDWGPACESSQEFRFKSAAVDQNTGEAITFPVRMWEVDSRPVD